MDTPETIAAEYLGRARAIDIGSVMSRSWRLVLDHVVELLGASLLAWLVIVVLGFVPIVGWLLAMVVGAGLEVTFLRRIRGEPAELGDVFTGFAAMFGNLAVAGLLTWLITAVGFLVFVVPGIYFLVAYMFVLPLIIDKQMDFWPAMEVSRRVVQRHFWSALGLLLVMAALVAVSLMLLVVPIVLALPIVTAALMYAYEDLFGPTATPAAAAPASRE